MIIKWPSEEERQRNIARFDGMAGMPGIVGAIDGTYVPIKAPSVNPEVYINRKCFHGITLQAICNHQRRFIDVFTGYPSSVSDVRIFRNSDIYQQIQANLNNYFGNGTFVIGDKAYPVTSWCVPPYIDRDNLTAAQRYFNRCHG